LLTFEQQQDSREHQFGNVGVSHALDANNSSSKIHPQHKNQQQQL